MINDEQGLDRSEVAGDGLVGGRRWIILALDYYTASRVTPTPCVAPSKISGLLVQGAVAEEDVP